MSNKLGRLHRQDYRSGAHGYRFGLQKVPGATTIIRDGLPKPALINWAAKVVGQAAAASPELFAELDEATAAKVAARVLSDVRDKAMGRGKAIHALAESYAKGEAVDVPPEHLGSVEQYARFMDEWHVDMLATEVVLGNRTHLYAGTADFIGYLDRHAVLVLGDIKTGATGIWPETCLQLAAYRYAEVYLDEHGQEQPMPRVDLCVGLWLQDDQYQVVPVDTSPAVFDAFLACSAVAKFQNTDNADLIGVPLTPMEVAL